MIEGSIILSGKQFRPYNLMNKFALAKNSKSPTGNGGYLSN